MKEILLAIVTSLIFSNLKWTSVTLLPSCVSLISTARVVKLYFRKLARYTSCKGLRCRKQGMDECDLEAIAALTGLERLKLGTCYLPSDAVHHLSRLLRLTTLHLRFEWEWKLHDRMACRCA